MKILKISFILAIIIFPIFFLPLNVVIFSPSQLKLSTIAISTDNGVSNYEITQSVTYEVEINFSLTHISYAGPGTEGDYWFKFSRLNDRQPNSSLTQYCGPYQESSLLYTNITGSTSTPFVNRDKFNNTYDVFNTTLAPTEKITLSQKYLVKLNEVFFSSVNTSEIGEYDTSDDIFALYCNNSEVYYEKEDNLLNATSYSIVNPSDNPVMKAQKICNWVSDYLTYSDSLPSEEKGAKWAYDNQMGDCSEYSTLMITLLRCQGIPARKVTGFVISADSTMQPYIGQKWTFFSNSNSQTNILGHAWVEYYVPNIGWIACDPTWNEEVDYFNHIDYLRFNFNIGAWFSIPQLSDESEFPHPCLVYEGDSSFDYEYNFKVVVISTNLHFPDFITIIIILIIIVAVIIVVVAIIIYTKKKRKSNRLSY
jgi:transglutaminase-like putative cysteine protease